MLTTRLFLAAGSDNPCVYNITLPCQDLSGCNLLTMFGPEVEVRRCREVCEKAESDQ